MERKSFLLYWYYVYGLNMQTGLNFQTSNNIGVVKIKLENKGIA